MTNRYRFEQQFFQYLQNIERNFNTRPLYLGGVGGSGGGSGGGNIIGTLPQTRVSYDLSELATDITVSGPSLLDNLNHIRWDIEVLQAMCGSGSGAGLGHIIYDDEISLSPREKLTILGAGVTIVDDEENDSTDITFDPSFLDLNDTPETYVGEAGKSVVVNETEDGLEFDFITSIGGNKILRYDAGGTVAEEYDVDETGLRAALAAAVAGDIVLLPPQTITVANDGTSAGVGSLKVNEGVTLRGMNREYSKIVATIITADVASRKLVYCYNGARLENLTIEYTRTNGGTADCVFYNYAVTPDEGMTLKDVTIIAESTDNDMDGIVIQIPLSEDRDIVGIDNCSVYVKTFDDGRNYVEVYGNADYATKAIIRNSTFVIVNELGGTIVALTALQPGMDDYGRLLIDNCYIYAELKVASSSTSRVQGINGWGIIELRNSFVIAKNAGTVANTETNAISLWASMYINYPNDDPLTDLILIKDCVGLAHSSSSSVSSSYPTRGLEIGDGTIIGGFYRATCDGSSNQVHGGYIDADNYDFDVRNATFNGDTYDIQANNSEKVRLYNCQYETLDELGGTTVLLRTKRDVKTVTGSITLDNTYDIVICSGEDFEVNLPTASSRLGLTYTFKRVDSLGGVVTISGSGGETIDDELYYELTNQYDKVTIVSNDTEWFTIG